MLVRFLFFRPAPLHFGMKLYLYQHPLFGLWGRSKGDRPPLQSVDFPPRADRCLLVGLGVAVRGIKGVSFGGCTVG